MSKEKLKQFYYLMRLHKPIGIFLLLWPTLWALWIAGKGKPNLIIVTIFILGVIVMRSAGCIINDFADRHFDKHVERTRERPLTSGKVSVTEALILFCILLVIAFLLVLLLNAFTFVLAFVGAILAIVYPFLKRITHLPQLGLGMAFAWGIPMSFAALQNTIPAAAWLLFLAAAILPVIYDTMYAMVDFADDIRIGVKSTAILFGRKTVLILGILQGCFLLLMITVGVFFKLKLFYFLSVVVAGILFVYQLFLIKNHDRENCFKAFLNNHYVGMALFVGVVLS